MWLQCMCGQVREVGGNECRVSTGTGQTREEKFVASMFHNAASSPQKVSARFSALNASSNFTALITSRMDVRMIAK